MCAWRFALLTEFAHFTNQCALQVLYDVMKAFENVDHDHLWTEAKNHGFNLVLLRYLLASYRMSRVVVVQKVATAPVKAS